MRPETEEKCKAAFAMVVSGMYKKDACSKVGIHPDTLNLWIDAKVDQAFAKSGKKYHKCLMCGMKIPPEKWYCSRCKLKKDRIAQTSMLEGDYIYAYTGVDNEDNLP